tara:strand:+ start:1481 stop:2272 length:792 start_codon:yes stop_codon:yes gene_type:complete
MRLAVSIVTLVVALLSVTAPACAAALFKDGPVNTDFRIFPGWQRVMAEMNQVNATPTVPVSTPTGSAPLAAATLTSAATSSGSANAGTQHVQGACTSPECRLAAWQAFIRETAKLPDAQQLDAVNRWANAHRYIEDWANWGLPDYWETPEEFFSRGGDCEDFAIIKYFTLAALGVSPDDMRIMVVNDTNLEIFHAVLAVRQASGEPLILDNQAKDVVPLSFVPHYRLIYSLNEKGWWMAPTPILINVQRAKSEPLRIAAGRED